MSRPLGVADLLKADRDSDISLMQSHWYWCRRHERAEHVSQAPHHSEGATDSGTHSTPCIRVGPFMSEREANRLHGHSEDGRVIWDKPLGMEVER